MRLSLRTARSRTPIRKRATPKLHPARATSSNARIGTAIYDSAVPTVETERLVLRATIEEDRARFVELFTEEAFMIFAGVLDSQAANARFDRMLADAAVVPYAKQPVIERASGTIVGYTGVATVVCDGIDRLEWGWRFVPEARGQGYATEATTALLAVADRHDDGQMLCIIAADNRPSRRVADKTGFRWWKRVDWAGDPADPTDLLVRSIGVGGLPLLASPRQRSTQ